MTPTHHPLKDGRTLLIREAGPADAAALLEFVETVSGESDFLTFRPGEFELTVEQEERYLQGCAESAHQVYLLALVEGDVVGSLNLASRDRKRVRHAGELGTSVRQSHWGLGVGGHLMATMIAWARGTGILTKINLRVRTDNQRAIALYEQHGFTVEGTISRGLRVSGRSFDDHWMGLEL